MNPVGGHLQRIEEALLRLDALFGIDFQSADSGLGGLYHCVDFTAGFHGKRVYGPLGRRRRRLAARYLVLCFLLGIHLHRDLVALLADCLHALHGRPQVGMRGLQPLFHGLQLRFTDLHSLFRRRQAFVPGVGFGFGHHCFRRLGGHIDHGQLVLEVLETGLQDHFVLLIAVQYFLHGAQLLLI